MTLGDSLGNGTTGQAPELNQPLETNKTMINAIKNGYPTDPLFKAILDSPEQHSKSFTICDSLIWMINNKKSKVVCLPRNRELITKVLTQAHEIVGHFSSQCTCEYVRQWYWWPRMVAESDNFC